MSTFPTTDPLAAAAPQADPYAEFMAMQDQTAPPPYDRSLEVGTEDVHGVPVAAGLKVYADEMERRFGLELTEGLRTETENARKKGAVKNSRHLHDGDAGALDFRGKARAMQDGAAWAQANGAVEALIHNPGDGQILHVAWGAK